MTSKSKAEKTFITWLRDAHAMEKQAETMLEGLSSRMDKYPDLKSRVDLHVIETREQASRLEACLERCGTSASTLKDLAAKTMAYSQGIAALFADDDLLKGVLMAAAFERFEMASYRSLIVAANRVGDIDTAEVCSVILHEEEAMAKWLDDHVDDFTVLYLRESSADGKSS